MSQNNNENKQDICCNEFYRISYDGKVTFTQQGMDKYKPYFQLYGINPQLIHNTKRLLNLLSLVRQADIDKRFLGRDLGNTDFIIRRINDAGARDDPETAFRLWNILDRKRDCPP